LARIALSGGIVTSDTADVKTVAPFRVKQGAAPPHADATLEFTSETKAAGAAGLPFGIKIQKPLMLMLGMSLALLVLVGVAAALTLRAPAPTTGALNVETDPPGAEVSIDNAVLGTTPLTLNLAEGRHSLMVQRGSNSKQLNVEIAANATNSYHIEWAAAAPLAAPLQTGSLSVLSDPPGSAVTVDGTSRGQTPLTIRDLCQAVGASERTLHLAFRQHLGTTPKAHLKALRLNAVRRDLRAAPPGTGVMDVAMRWGFFHAGWLSQDYRRMFGESPSTTLGIR